MTFPTINLLAIAPQIILVVAACITLLLDLILKNKRNLGWFSPGFGDGGPGRADLLAPCDPRVPTRRCEREYGAG